VIPGAIRPGPSCSPALGAHPAPEHQHHSVEGLYASGGLVHEPPRCEDRRVPAESLSNTPTEGCVSGLGATRPDDRMGLLGGKYSAWRRSCERGIAEGFTVAEERLVIALCSQDTMLTSA